MTRDRRETALICAARTGQLDCVRHLLNYGADPELRDGEGHTALWCAVREQREKVRVKMYSGIRSHIVTKHHILLRAHI